ncbi:hypothetical protein GOODEAATRI_023409 [Goodea atripinnis]|uniref:Uncharacterized protein n=1 Tax=Goodea atripinnis TaxID=208336 RepID=A0ABV0NMP8_9TELE
MRMILPEHELVVKNCSQLLSRDTTCSMSSSTLPFLLKSNLLRHCVFHRVNVLSIADEHAAADQKSVQLVTHPNNQLLFMFTSRSRSISCSITRLPHIPSSGVYWRYFINCRITAPGW